MTHPTKRRLATTITTDNYDFVEKLVNGGVYSLKSEPIEDGILLAKYLFRDAQDLCGIPKNSMNDVITPDSQMVYFHLLKRAPQFFDCLVQQIKGHDREIVPASATIAKIENAQEYLNNAFVFKNRRNASLLSDLENYCSASDTPIDDAVHSALTLFMYGAPALGKFGNAKTQELLKEIESCCSPSSHNDVINSALMTYLQIIKSMGSALKENKLKELSSISYLLSPTGPNP